MTPPTYTRLTTITGKCYSCMGMGHKWDPVYHNQLKKVECHACNGTGERQMIQPEDATEYVHNLENEIKTLNAKLSKYRALNFDLITRMNNM